MFYVTSLDGSQVEPLINISTDFKSEQSVDGTFQVSFTCFPSGNNPGYDLLRSESVITVEGNDFKVKQYRDTAFSKSITAVSIFYEHSKTQRNGVFSGNHTLNNHLSFALNGTGWTYTVDSAIANATNHINNFGNDNIVSLVQKICKYHECEFIILPNKRLHFAKQIGGDYDYQYRYKHNVSDVVLVEDSTNLYTFIRGYGADGLEVSYTSPNLSTFGKLEATAIRDDRFKDAVALTNYIKNSIKDVPDLAIESTIPELTSRETGERIWLIYEPLNVAMQTRILKQTKVLRDGKLITDSVVFGNTLIKSSIDILVEQQEQINDNKNYIDDTKDELNETIVETKEEINETIDNEVREISYKFQETETKIIDQYQTITNEYSASITANAREIRTEMSQKETTINNKVDAQYTQITAEYNSSISQTAQAIRSDVSASITAVNGSISNVQQYASSIEQTAQQIQSTVSSQQTMINSQGTRISYAESSITQQAQQISLKVDVNGVIGAINLSPEVARIQARNIELVGAVSVLSDITNGALGTITSGHINISESATIGTTLQIGQDWQSSYPKAIRFADQYSSAGIAYSGGSLTISAVDAINLDADNINVLGNLSGNIDASSVNGITMAYSASGGKKYITFRQSGAYLGQVEIV